MDVDPERLDREQLLNLVYNLQAKLEAYEVKDIDRRKISCRDIFKLSPTEARLAIILSDGRPRSRQVVFDLMFWDRADAPDTKIIDVYACKVRRKLKKFSINIKVVNSVSIEMPEFRLFNSLIDGEAAPVASALAKTFSRENRVAQ